SGNPGTHAALLRGAEPRRVLSPLPTAGVASAQVRPTDAMRGLMARRRLRAGDAFTLCRLGGRMPAWGRAVCSRSGATEVSPSAVAPDAARGGESRPGPSWGSYLGAGSVGQ